MNYERFRDYLYYLLPSPLKRVKEAVNQWYIFLSVIGDAYDRVQAELERAVEETTIATCSDVLLQYYAEDRGMHRYPDEPAETFRARIAMQDEVEALGGTKAALLLAAKTLGYEQVEHVWLPDLGYPDKWSQFLIRITVADGQEHPVDFGTLVSEIRKVKDSTSLDNYCFCSLMGAGSRIYTGAAVSVVNHVEVGEVR